MGGHSTMKLWVVAFVLVLASVEGRRRPPKGPPRPPKGPPSPPPSGGPPTVVPPSGPPSGPPPVEEPPPVVVAILLGHFTKLLLRETVVMSLHRVCRLTPLNVGNSTSIPTSDVSDGNGSNYL